MLDKILPIHGKCLYLQYANNLNISIMKAYQILDLVFKLDLRNDQCCVCHGADIYECGPDKYFGAYAWSGSFDKESDYFLFYVPSNEELGFFPCYDVLFWDKDNGAETFCWKIEN